MHIFEDSYKLLLALTSYIERGIFPSPKIQNMQTNLFKGLIAGMVGAAVATKIKSELEKVLPVRKKTTDSPPVVLADRVAKKMENNDGLDKEEKKPVEKTIHWSFGVLMGGVYGVSVERNPSAAAGFGSLAGTALYGGTHGSVLPALDTEPWPTENKPEFVVNEFIGHIVYGMTTEIIRRQVRKLLG
jgi:putative membrane protein